MRNKVASNGQNQTSLMKAGDDLRDMGIAEFGALLGGAVVLGELAQQLDAKRLQAIQRIKKEKLFERLGFKTWEDCCVKMFGPKRTMDRKIAELETYGPDYFGLRQIVRVGKSVYELMDVKDGCILHDGEEIPINKQNEGRIKEIVGAYKDRVEKAESALTEKTREAEEAKKARSAATKAAEKARQEFLEYKKAQAARFPNADEDYTNLLDAQSLFDLAMAKLAGIYHRDLSEENQARYIGLTEYFYRQLIQATFEARDKYGVGWNMAEPAELLGLDQVAPGPRNLMAEYTTKKEEK